MSDLSDAITDALPELLDAMGDSVSYQPSGGLAYSVDVIWTEGQPAEQQNRAAMAMAWARVADFTVAPQKGEEITRSGKVYRIAENPNDRLDGVGGVTLILRYVRDAA